MRGDLTGEGIECRRVRSGLSILATPTVGERRRRAYKVISTKVGRAEKTLTYPVRNREEGKKKDRVAENPHWIPKGGGGAYPDFSEEKKRSSTPVEDSTVGEKLGIFADLKRNQLASHGKGEHILGSDEMERWPRKILKPRLLLQGESLLLFAERNSGKEKNLKVR